MSRPLLLGHRGARAVKSIPENTLASFDRAVADGCDGFEFDVRLTGKRVLVWTVNASADMKRFAESDVDGIISDKTSLLCRTLAV
jgi:glycerophosphoryl diester phosphodiesterase